MMMCVSARVARRHDFERYDVDLPGVLRAEESRLSRSVESEMDHLVLFRVSSSGW